MQGFGRNAGRLIASERADRAISASAFAFQNIEADALYEGLIKQEILQEYTKGLEMLKAQADGSGTAQPEGINDEQTGNLLMERLFASTTDALEIALARRERREGRDINALRQHMYDKALLMGQCVDKAITLKKTLSDNILLDKYVGECVKTHLEFLRRERPFRAMCSFETTSKALGSTAVEPDGTEPLLPLQKAMGINRPYDFLEDQKRTQFVVQGLGDWATYKLRYDFAHYSLIENDYISVKECYDKRREVQCARINTEIQANNAMITQLTLALEDPDPLIGGVAYVREQQGLIALQRHQQFLTTSAAEHCAQPNDR